MMTTATATTMRKRMGRTTSTVAGGAALMALLVGVLCFCSVPSAEAQLFDVGGSVDNPVFASEEAEYVYGLMSQTYFYGVTKPMVDRLLNRSSIPILEDILNLGDAFPRQDNTVVFLGYLSNDTDSGADTLRSYWLGFTQTTAASARRSMLLVPHSLGLMMQLQASTKARDVALELLANLGVPASSRIHEALPKLSSDVGEQLEATAAIVKQLVRGLTFYNQTLGAEAALAVRQAAANTPADSALESVLENLGVDLEREVEDGIGRDLGLQTDKRKGLFNFSPRARRDGGPPSPILFNDDDDSGNNNNNNNNNNNDDDDGGGGGGNSASTTDASGNSLFSTRTTTTTEADNQEILMSWCVHTAMSEPFTESLVDAIAASMTDVTVTAEQSFDTPCCVGFANAGGGADFGAQGDGLSVVDNEREANEVFRQTCGRVKGVNAINYCGQPASNVIGCAPVGGDTQMLVRLDTPDDDSRLWLHETGHNVGLNHNDISNDYVMYATLTGDSDDNFAFTQEECGAFVNPPPSAEINKRPASNLTCDPSATPPPNDDGDSGGSGGVLDGTTSWVVLAIGIAVLLAGIAVGGYLLAGNGRGSGAEEPMHSSV